MLYCVSNSGDPKMIQLIAQVTIQHLTRDGPDTNSRSPLPTVQEEQLIEVSSVSPFNLPLVHSIYH